MKPAPLLQDWLPELAAELVSRLEQSGELALARQIPTLRLLDHDRSSEAVAIYTQSRLPEPYGPSLRNVQLRLRRGMAILDVVADGVACIEIVGRVGAVRARLRELAERDEH